MKSKDSCYVYRHRRLDTNEIFYIGIGSTKNFKRAYSKDNRNVYWKRITSKYKYEVEILAYNLSWEDACELEVLLISEYGRKDLGTGTLVNMTDGGEGGLGAIRTEDSKKSSSERMKGDKNPMFGKTHTKEASEKIRKAQLGRKKSDEERRRQSERIRNNPLLFTKEHRDKISEGTRGDKNGMFGRTYDKNPRARKVIDTETGIVYGSVREASELFNIGFSSLYAYLTGARLNKTKLEFYENL